MKPQRNHTYRPLDDTQIETIHKSTVEVLSETGFEVHNERAWELYKKVAASVDSDRHVVRLSEKNINDLLSQVPSELVLYGRKPENHLRLGSGQVYFGTGGTALNVYEHATSTCRQATMEDLVDIIRITDKLDNIDMMLLPTYPNELPVERVDLNRFIAGLTYTSKHIMGGVYTPQGIRDVIAMAEHIAGSKEKLRREPIISMITCGISPLRLDDKYGGFMMQVAESGIPAVVPAEPLCGATAPMSLAGTLVIQNCDALINVMLTQLVNPGTPVIYGCVASSTDLRDLGYIGGPVESGLLNAAAAQMSQHYGIPYYATAGISDSKVLDAQCGYESAVNNLLVGLAGADFIHDAAGLMEFAMTVSKEKLVIDNEILGMAQRAIRGIEMDDNTLALDVIKQVGPGGNFLTTRHARRYMHREHYRPQLSDRDKRSAWEAQGQQDAAQRAQESVRRLLSAPVHRYVEDQVLQEVLRQFPAIEAPHIREETLAC